MAHTFFSTIFNVTPAKVFLVPFDMNKSNLKKKMNFFTSKKIAGPKTEKCTFGLQSGSEKAKSYTEGQILCHRQSFMAMHWYIKFKGACCTINTTNIGHLVLSRASKR